MKSSAGSSTIFTVFAKELIEQVSPEVAGNVPSILFTASDLDALHQQVSAVTDTASAINEAPFRNFNFASPGGIYFAVKG